MKTTVKNIALIFAGLALVVLFIAFHYWLEGYRAELIAQAKAAGAQFVIIMEGAALGRYLGIDGGSGALLWLSSFVLLVFGEGSIIFGIMNIKEDRAERARLARIAEEKKAAAERAEFCARFEGDPAIIAGVCQAENFEGGADYRRQEENKIINYLLKIGAPCERTADGIITTYEAAELCYINVPSYFAVNYRRI